MSLVYSDRFGSCRFACLLVRHRVRHAYDSVAPRCLLHEMDQVHGVVVHFAVRIYVPGFQGRGGSVTEECLLSDIGASRGLDVGVRILL